MRALVTGGTGFIGSHLVGELLGRGVQVVNLGRGPSDRLPEHVQQINVDLADRHALEEALTCIEPCDVVFHFAARISAEPEWTSFANFLAPNVVATGLLLGCAKKWNVQKFVYASSLSLIGKPDQLPISEDHAAAPLTDYHLSKYLAETACEHYSRCGWVPAVSLRITSPYGPGMKPDSVMPRFIDRARRSQNIHLYGSGCRTQNFVHVSDVVRAALLAIDRSSTGIYNVAGPTAVSMKELAEVVVRSVPSFSSSIEFLDRKDPQEDCRWDVDVEKALKKLGYQPAIELEDGLIAMLKDESEVSDE